MPEPDIAQSIHLLFQRIQDGQRIVGKLHWGAGDWQELHRLTISLGFREPVQMENTEWYIDYAREYVVKKFRDELFADAIRLAFGDNSLPIPPAQGNDPESDMRALLAWCIQFKRTQDNKVASPAKPVIDAVRTAYNQYEAVLGIKSALANGSMRDVYAELERSAGVAGVELPAYDTWSRYVRSGKQQFESNPDGADS
jgi:hypothetical protein